MKEGWKCGGLYGAGYSSHKNNRARAAAVAIAIQVWNKHGRPSQWIGKLGTIARLALSQHPDGSR